MSTSSNLIAISSLFSSHAHPQASSRCSSGKGYIVSVVITIHLHRRDHRSNIFVFPLSFLLSSPPVHLDSTHPTSCVCVFLTVQCDSEGDDDKVSNKNFLSPFFSVCPHNVRFNRMKKSKRKEAYRRPFSFSFPLPPPSPSPSSSFLCLILLCLLCVHFKQFIHCYCEHTHTN
jgi:hypothetical protein